MLLQASKEVHEDYLGDVFGQLANHVDIGRLNVMEEIRVLFVLVMAIPANISMVELRCRN
jgi:hypothetical protein